MGRDFGHRKWLLASRKESMARFSHCIQKYKKYLFATSRAILLLKAID